MFPGNASRDKLVDLRDPPRLDIKREQEFHLCRRNFLIVEV